MKSRTVVARRPCRTACTTGIGVPRYRCAIEEEASKAREAPWVSISGGGGDLSACVVADACLDTVQAVHALGEAGMAQRVTVALEVTWMAAPEMRRCGSGSVAWSDEIDLTKMLLRSVRRSRRSLSTPAKQGGNQPAGRRVPRQAASAGRYPGLGERPGHHGQRARAHPSQRRGAIPSCQHPALTDTSTTTIIDQTTTVAVGVGPSGTVLPGQHVPSAVPAYLFAARTGCSPV